GDAGYHDGEKISVKVFSGGNEIEIATAESAYFGEGFFSVVELTSAIIVSDFALHGNYPNPFNPSTKIVFDVSATADIDLTIYNIIGQEVRRLQNGQLDHGSYQITWDGLDNSGNMVSSGVYFYRMTWTTEEISGQETQKMVLLR
ncbi:T9SS type A sorting domain-containing protein, partial [bacterium]|nr:T9SS type A sorting domain-containing protein [bacterium]